MPTEDLSQPSNATPPVEDFSLPGAPTVTAGATAPDNATPDTSNPTVTAPQGTEAPAAMAGEGGDDESRMQEQPPSKEEQLSDYQQAKAKFFATRGNAPAQAPQATPPTQATAQPAPQAAPSNAGEEEDDFPSAPVPGGKAPQIKVRLANPVDVQLLAGYKAYAKAGGNLTMVEYVRQMAPAPAGTATPGHAGETEHGDSGDNQSGQTSPTTVAEVTQQLNAILEEKRQALADWDMDKIPDLDKQMLELTELKAELKQAEKQAGQEIEAQREQEATRYLETAGKMFPQAVNPQDPLAIRANDIFTSWANANDPRAFNPSGYLYCYVEAAAEMGINAQPTSPAPKHTSPPPPARHGAPVTALIASGQATMTQPRTVEAPLSDENYHLMKQQFLARHTAARRPVPRG